MSFVQWLIRHMSFLYHTQPCMKSQKLTVPTLSNIDWWVKSIKIRSFSQEGHTVRQYLIFVRFCLYNLASPDPQTQTASWAGCWSVCNFTAPKLIYSIYFVHNLFFVVLAIYFSNEVLSIKQATPAASPRNQSRNPRIDDPSKQCWRFNPLRHQGRLN